MSDLLSQGVLYLVPVPIGNKNIEGCIPIEVKNIVSNLQNFIVEHPKTARHFLKQIDTKLPLQSLAMETLNEHTSSDTLENLLRPLLQGKDVGLMSEAGCPGVADPGANLIALAHKKGIQVIPLVGPSSILLALMGSGLNGQRFAFHGYLPADKPSRLKKIVELEKESALKGQTQIFIETPYRNPALLNDLVNTLNASTQLCLAVDLMCDTEKILTREVEDWKKSLPDVNKRLAIFLFLARSKK